MKNLPDKTAGCIKTFAAVEDTLYVIAGKWRLSIIAALSEGGKGFNELQRMLTGISAKVLSNELRELELNRLLERIEHHQMPVSVEYRLSAYGFSLKEVVHVLNDWGKGHREILRSK